MQARRQYHNGSGARSRDHHSNHASNRRGRGRGGSGRGGHSSSNYHGSYWFKGEGYNDHEAISIDEEVVGISGYLSAAQPGFSGLVKQRFSDFVVHEIAQSGQQVELTSLAKKKKHVSAQFQELVNGFAYGKSYSNNAASISNSNGDDGNAHQAECEQIVRDMGENLDKQSCEYVKQGRSALDKHNVRKLIELVAAELGATKGSEFEAFIEKVKALKLADEEALRLQHSNSNANGTASTSSLPSTTTTQGSEPLVFYIGGLNEKRDRVYLHETMRRYGKSLIVADTITLEDHSQVIRIRRALLTAGEKGERDPRNEWPVEQPDYLQFVLYRRNKDITGVLNQIASMLKVHTATFSYAEAKDKRGITTQLCTAYRIQKERLEGVQRIQNTSKSLDEFQFLIGGNLKYVSTPLRVGDCQGNAFSIVIRALAANDLETSQAVQDTITQWRDRGFINFFGLQRFGGNAAAATPFQLIGRAILRKDFKLAVRLLLRPQEGEASKIREAREHFRQHKDVAAALRMLPPFLVPERAVLEGLLQHGIDADELAFRNIPLTLRVAYVDAYQSYVWNAMASERIAKLPSDRAVVGDLVFASSTSEPAKKKQKRDNGRDTQSAEMAKQPKQEILVLTEENADQYGIDDVVLPLPGHSIVYPANDIGSAYEKLMKADGVDMASWRGAGGAHHQYQLDGMYRHVIKKPTNVSAVVKEYTNANKPMLLTDVDRLLGRGSDSKTPSATMDASIAVPERAAVTPAMTSTSGDEEKEAVKKIQRALVLHFGLDYGSDATIAVRELMKQSSSMHVQWQLSDKVQSREALATKKGKVKGAGASATTAASTATQSIAGGKKQAGATVIGVGGAKKRGNDKTIIAPKKTHVSIGRPGFSLGKQ
uniref:TRUD domain-containing protein n=1 Tax=Globisporangium ultimum (strain ATCC 200006 / CBS 805.95 / DAOM BR144) TaxID=431595 RepID=K3WA30_GLOUD